MRERVTYIFPNPYPCHHHTNSSWKLNHGKNEGYACHAHHVDDWPTTIWANGALGESELEKKSSTLTHELVKPHYYTHKRNLSPHLLDQWLGLKHYFSQEDFSHRENLRWGDLTQDDLHLEWKNFSLHILTHSHWSKIMEGWDLMGKTWWKASTIG